jgi:formylglycine-generating enzyme required for sulfatase activity
VPRLFISHSSKDNLAAIAFKQWLGSIGWPNEDVFLDLEDIGAGERWKEALNKANARCEAIVLLASPDALRSPECIAEIRKAEDAGKEIIVVLLHDLQLDDRRLDSYKDRQIVDLAAPPLSHVERVDYRGELHEIRFNQKGLARVQDFLDKRGITSDRFAWPSLNAPDAAPFPGLSAFTEDDAGIFFGRDTDIIRGLDRLRILRRNGRPRLMVIQAASGAGKSSYLRAGLWPRLIRDSDFVPLSILRPAKGILTGPQGLGSKLAAQLSRPTKPVTPGEMHAQLTSIDLTQATKGFAQLLRTITAQALEQRRIGDNAAVAPALVIAVDQAEELFDPDDKSESDRFLQLMASLLRESNSGIDLFCLLTIRSDRAPELFQATADLDIELPETFPLLPLPHTAYRDVILKPLDVLARRGQRLTLTPELADKLVSDASGADALPLLAFTISHLYHEYAASGTLTLHQYENLGGTAGSIDMALKQALAQPANAPQIPVRREEQLSLLRATFIPWLTRINPDSSAALRRVAFIAEFSQQSQAMVARLVEARLLVLDRRADGDVVEVAHESLLRQWPVLSEWLKAEADNLKLIEGVERATAQWEHQSRLPSWIDHRGERLFLAEELLTREDFQGRFEESVLEYLAACRALESPAFRRLGADLLPLGLERSGLNERSFTWPPTNDPKRAPYRGLRALEANDAAILYGRDTDILRGLERVRRLTEARNANLLIILGGSGVGKSSFLCAGLWPRLNRYPQDFLALPVIRADQHDLEQQLSNALADAFRSLDVTRSPGDVEKQLSVSSASRLQLLDDLLDLANRKHTSRRNHPTILLVIDQLHSLFLNAPKQAQHFHDFLTEVLDSDRRILVIATMRSDAFHLIESDDRRLSIAKQELFNLPPMGEDQLYQIISRPAELSSKHFDPPTLPAKLSKEVAQGSGSLPLLAFLLEEAWSQSVARGEGVIKVPPDEIGDVLTKRGELFLAQHKGSEEDLSRLFTSKLVSLREDGEPVRRLALRSELSLVEWDLAHELADNPYRLLVVASTQDGNTSIEVAHEAIFRSWGRLRHWLDLKRDFFRWRAGAERAQVEWQIADRRSNALLVGLPLAQAESWLARYPEDISGAVKTFVSLSAKAASQSKSRTRRFQILVYVLLLGVIVNLVGWINQDAIRRQWHFYTVERPFISSQVSQYVLSADEERTLKSGDSFKECRSDCPAMVVVPAGTLNMGSAPNEPYRYANEGPQHEVQIAQPFAVSATELTFEDWDTCVAVGDCDAKSDLGFGRGLQPIIGVSLREAQRYAAWLSRITGKQYHLLTEAEYEYAARAGSPTSYPWGEDLQLNGSAMANCNGCGSRWDNQTTAPVRSFRSNAFKLYDMVGNVWEWVADCYHASYQGAPTDGSAWTGACSVGTIRGGSWSDNPSLIRSAARNSFSVTGSNNNIGFRVARTLSPP